MKPIRSDWNWLLAVTIACTLLIPVVLFVASCGGSPPSAEAPVVGPPAGEPPSAACGDGLAAVDLSGRCRATPQATMGALEAIS